MMAVAVSANPVTAGDISLVFNRAGDQQRLPVQRARRRPVSDIQRQIIVVLITRPYRKAQVVTDQRQDPPSTPYSKTTLVSGLIVMMFIGHTEQVPFIIMVHRTVRLDQQEAVNSAVFSLQRSAAGNQRLGLRGRACIHSTNVGLGKDCFAASMAKPVVDISGKTITLRPVIPSSWRSNGAGWQDRPSRPAVVATAKFPGQAQWSTSIR